MTADVLGFLQCLGIKGVKPSGPSEVIFSCVNKQGHKNGDRNPSARINTTTGVWVCYACQAKGRAYDLARIASLEETAARELAVRHGLWTENANRGAIAIRSPRPAQIAASAASRPVDIQVSTSRHLEPAPKSDSPGSPTKRTILETYDYVDEHGEHLFQSIRFEPKGFSQRRLVDGKWVWNLNGTRRVLYRLPKIIDAARNGETIYICEGEKDVHALEHAGEVATCNPEGANKWRAEFSEFLVGANVVVIVDQDPIGKKHADEVAESVRPFAKTVRIVNPQAGKDAHDHLAAGLSPADFKPDEDVRDDRPNESTWLPTTLPIGTEPLTPDIDGLFFAGLSHTVSGASESGKTMLTYAAAIGVARDGGHVVIVDFEMGPRLAARRLIDALGLAEEEVEHLVNNPETRRIHFVHPQEPLDLGTVKALLGAIGGDPELVLIDAMTSALEIQGLDSNSDTDVEALYRMLVRPFQRTGAAVVVIDHPGKDAGRGDKGSIRKRQAPDVCFVVRPTTPYRDGRGASTITVEKDRPNAFDRDASMHFVLDRPTWRFETGERPKTGPPTTLMQRVSERLETHGPAPSASQLEKDVIGNNPGIRAAIKTLIEEGYATGGHRAPIVSVRPYRQADDPRSGWHPVHPSNPVQSPSQDERLRPRPPVPHPIRGTGDGADIRRASTPSPQPRIDQETAKTAADLAERANWPNLKLPTFSVLAGKQNWQRFIAAAQSTSPGASGAADRIREAITALEVMNR